MLARERWSAWSWPWRYRLICGRWRWRIPGLVLERRLISARFAALYDRARMEGLYEVTLEANRGLRQQAVLETILGSVRRLLRSPGGHPDA